MKANGSEPHAPPLQAIEMGQFLDMQLEEPAAIVGRLLREGTLAMIHGRAGAGKTFLMLSMAISASYGIPLLEWDAQTPVATIYVDGEMTATELQQRSKALMQPILATLDHAWQPLHIVTPDFSPLGVPKIDTVAGRDAILELVDHTGARVVFLDNLSCLTNPEDDNASSSWSAVQELLLALRRHSVAAVVGHHSGKNGEQRGTSRRADILDLVLKLSPMPDVEADGRTHVQIEFEKARALRAEEKETFVATLETHPQGGLMWTRSAPALAVGDRVRQMLLDGMNPGEIAAEAKVNRSYCYRIQKEMQETGELNSSRPSRRGLSPVSSLRGGAQETTPPSLGDKRGRQIGDSRRHGDV